MPVSWDPTWWHFATQGPFSLSEPCATMHFLGILGCRKTCQGIWLAPEISLLLGQYIYNYRCYCVCASIYSVFVPLDNMQYYGYTYMHMYTDCCTCIWLDLCCWAGSFLTLDCAVYGSSINSAKEIHNIWRESRVLWHVSPLQQYALLEQLWKAMRMQFCWFFPCKISHVFCIVWV